MLYICGCLRFYVTVSFITVCFLIVNTLLFCLILQSYNENLWDGTFTLFFASDICDSRPFLRQNNWRQFFFVAKPCCMDVCVNEKKRLTLHPERYNDKDNEL